MTTTPALGGPVPRKSAGYETPLTMRDLTLLNLRVLARTVKEFGDANGVFQKIDPTAVPHIRRCIRAGAVESAGQRGSWRVSAAGKSALSTETPE